MVLLVLLLLCWTSALYAATPDIFSFTLKTIEGKEFPLASVKGSVLLFVNTASKCGFTPQYKDLEDLYQRYKSKGFVILGFPSNDFGDQEPGTNEDIKQFCKLRYGVTFPLFQKNSVFGDSAQPVFKYLTTVSEPLSGEIKWNFEKFLVDKKGVLRTRFGSHVNPSSGKLTSKIEELLNE